MRQVITKAQVDAVIEIMYETYGTGSEDSFRADYSGRGMSGTGCVGFVVSGRELLSVGAALTEALRPADEDDVDYREKWGLLHYMITNACVDNMGLNMMIVYFPGVTLMSEEN